MFFILIKTLV